MLRRQRLTIRPRFNYLVVGLGIAPTLALGEAFLILDGHRCLDAVDTGAVAVSMICDPVDTYAVAIMGALFDAGHIAIDAPVELQLPLWDENDPSRAPDGTYREALQLAREAGTDILVLVLGATHRSSADGGKDAVEYFAKLSLLMFDVSSGDRLGSDHTERHYTGTDSPIARRDFVRRTSSTVAQIVLDAWRDASQARQETT